MTKTHNGSTPVHAYPSNLSTFSSTNSLSSVGHSFIGHAISSTVSFDTHDIHVNKRYRVALSTPNSFFTSLLNFTRTRNYRAREYARLCSHLNTMSEHSLISPEEKAKVKICVELLKEIRRDFKEQTKVVKKRYQDAGLAVPIAVRRGDALKNPKKSKPKQEVNILDYVNTK